MIEIMIVCVVIGVLAAIAFPSYKIQLLKVKNQEAIRILMAVWEAQKDYFRDTGVYTNNINNLAITIPPPKNFNNPFLFPNLTIPCGGSNKRMVAAISPNSDPNFSIYVTEDGSLFCIAPGTGILCMQMGLTKC